MKASLQHLSVFIRKYHSIPEFNHLGLSPGMDTSAIPFNVINDEEFVGRWATFLAEEAKHLDGSNHLLSLSSASGYASTFASYYINHHRNESEIPRPLKKELWCKKMSKITEKKTDYHNETKTKIKGQKETATTEDRQNLNKVLIWNGTSDSADFLHLCNTCQSVAGRGSDVGALEKKDISVISRSDPNDLSQYEVIGLDVNRIKTSNQKIHQIFPHRDHMELDDYFSQSYALIMGNVSMSGTHLFPRFAEKLFNKDGKVSSKVSTFFNKCLDEAWQIMYDFTQALVGCFMGFNLSNQLFQLTTLLLFL